jgi:hypothetical protein
MADWQPMDSAPRDGREVMLYFPSLSGKKIFVAHFVKFSGIEYWNAGYIRTWNEGGPEPTRWMQMPEAPTQ